MLKRTVTAGFLIALLVGLFAVSYFVEYGQIFLDLFIWVLLVIATREMYFCMQEAGFKLFRVPLAVYLLSCYPAIYLTEHFLGQGYLGLIISFGASVVASLIVFTFADPERNTAKDLFATVFVTVYPGALVSLAWVLSMRFSAVYVIPFAIFLPVGADTFAYWVGSLVGGKKLCPTISPKRRLRGSSAVCSAARSSACCSSSSSNSPVGCPQRDTSRSPTLFGNPRSSTSQSGSSARSSVSSATSPPPG